MNKIAELPLLKPLLALLKSRKFMVAVVTLGVNMLIAQEPRLEPVRTELMTILTLVGTVLIGAIAHEDASKSSGPKVLS